VVQDRLQLQAQLDIGADRAGDAGPAVVVERVEEDAAVIDDPDRVGAVLVEERG
jgi:hypothetical protein